MGKVRPKRKNKPHNHNPTGLPSVKNVIENEDITNGSLSSSDTTIQTAIDQIQSIEIEDKLCGLQMLANVFTNKEDIEKLIETKVIKMVAPFLLDQNPDLRNFTAGALRNLSACGSVEICEHIVKEDIMTPLIALIQQCGDWRPEQTKPKQPNDHTDTLIQAVNLLWNLCESDETAVKYFNSKQLLCDLINYLDFDMFGLDLAIVVCQCLHTVSEDNSSAVAVLRNYESQFAEILKMERDSVKLLQLQTLIAGLVINCSSCTNVSMPVLTTLSRTLSSDYRTKLSHLSSQVPLQSSVLLDEVTETLAADCAALLEAHITAMEILTNLCSSQDDEMEQDSDDTLSDDVDQEEDGWTEADTTQPLDISPELHEAMIKLNFLENVYKSTAAIPENVSEILDNCGDTKLLVKKFKKLRQRAFLCLSNVVSVLDIEDMGSADNLYSVWTTIGKLLLIESDVMDEEYLEAVTSAMRSVLVRLASVNYPQLGALPVSDLEFLQQLSVRSKEPHLRGNIVRIIGTLGVLFANINNLEMTKAVGVILLSSADKEAELWLVAETLDAIMDVFSEDSTDQAAYDISLVPQLKTLAPILKRKLRQERKKQPEHYAILSTAAMNLGRFIMYKGNRIEKLIKSVPQ